ncbi:MAG: hypothetical protein RLZZ292_1468 [Bacteroidota bacterium]|jgi:hypothetical protein
MQFNRKLSFIIHHSSLIIIFFLLIGCKDEKAHQAAIDAMVQSKVDNYRKQQLTERQLKVLEIANRKADSILLKNAALWQIDSTLRPDLPSRPTKPTFSNENDTIPVKPLFKPSSFKKL